MKLSDIVSSFLIEKGISTVFGIIGSANSHLYDSFVKHGIQVLNVHNEQAAVIAASSYYRTCNKIAIALVTAGGGATNSITGIVSAWADSIPVIILTGQESSFYMNDYKHRRMYGTQGVDIVHMVSKSTKYASTIMEADMIQNELEKIYSIALDDRKGPVLLDIPFNIQGQDINKRVWNKYTPSIIKSNGIDEIAKLLEQSKKPVFLCGHGIKLSNGIETFHLLLEKIKIPTLVTWSAIDVMSHDHMLFFGSPGVYGQRAANFIFQKSDLIIVLGSRLGLPQTGYDIKELARNAKIIMVDVDLTENKSFVHTFVHSDCKDFCNQLLGYSHDCSGWIDECKTIREQFPIIEDSHVDGEFPNSYKIIDSISRFLKPNHVVVTDMGTALLSGHQAIHIKHYGTKMFSSYGLGEMGYGLPAAFGAGIAAPEKEIICLNCDGGMMMNLQELQTIIQHGLNIKIIIFNNDGYLMIKHTQKMLFNGEYTAVNKSTGIVLPDYIKLTKAFGYETYQIKSWSDFDTYFPEVMNCKTPVVCEIFMPPEQDFIPKVKGVLQKNGSIFAPPIEEMSPLISLSTIQNVMQNEISTKSMIIERPIHE